MPSLKELFSASRGPAVEDCVALIDLEVKDKSGLSGIAIKAGYAMVNGVRPTFVKDAVDRMLDQFADKLDPVFQEAKAKGVPVAAHFEANKSKVADALLEITDDRAAKPGQSAAVVKTYGKLRPTAKQNVEAAAARLGKLVEKYDR
ncbi:MAG: hypothetical protein IT374_14925 [Polyangiaceae bacterium]|nr:hypothetical protein [Polyangiaceae bacterium]